MTHSTAVAMAKVHGVHNRRSAPWAAGRVRGYVTQWQRPAGSVDALRAGSSGGGRKMQSHARVVIVGGGIMGVGLLYHLAL